MKKSIPFNGTPGSGAIRYIKKVSKHENIHSFREIEIKVSSNKYLTSHLMTIPIGINNPSFTDYWVSDNAANQWFQIDFRSYKVIVNSYDYHASSWDYFSNWQLLGSNDETSWKVIDKKTITSYPSSTILEEKHYECSEGNNEPFSYIRLQVSGTRKYPDFYLGIYCFDVYGTIIDKNRKCTNAPKRKCLLNTLIFNIIGLS